MLPGEQRGFATANPYRWAGAGGVTGVGRLSLHREDDRGAQLAVPFGERGAVPAPFAYLALARQRDPVRAPELRFPRGAPGRRPREDAVENGAGKIVRDRD